MKNKKTFKLGIFTFGLGVWILLCGIANVFGQIDEVSRVKQNAKTTIRPKAKPVSQKVNVTRKVSIVRVEKKSRTIYRKSAGKTKVATKTKPVVKRMVVPLLAAQLQLLRVDEQGDEIETNPLAALHQDDRLRLSIKTNQRGYLYIIRQSAPEADGEIIFPTTLVNNGSNYVNANLEYIIPRGCPKNYAPEPRDCALKLFPYEEAPQEYFTLIFTRDSLIDLPNDANNKRGNISNLMSAGKIEAKTLIDLIEESGQDLISQQGDSQYAMRIVNINPKDNEEIIETFVLNKINQ